MGWVGVQSQLKCFQVKLQAKKGVGVHSEVSVLSSEYGTSCIKHVPVSLRPHNIISNSDLTSCAETFLLFCLLAIHVLISLHQHQMRGQVGATHFKQDFIVSESYTRLLRTTSEYQTMKFYNPSLCKNLC